MEETVFCSGCGGQLADDANFCLKCGKRQRPDVDATEGPMEIAEIEYSYREVRGGFLGLGVETFHYFVAKAVGPNGEYTVAKSNEYLSEYMDDKLAGPALNSLLKQLTKDGWQPLPRGQMWYSYRFRRPATTGRGTDL